MTWRSEAACRSVDPEVFFPNEGGQSPSLDLALARAVCSKCPVSGECADLALRLKVSDGVWGGFTASELRRTASSVNSPRRQCA